MTSSARPAERGNVLLLTLLALILFGAICYALIIPAGEVSTDQERELVSAAQITQYPAMLRTSVRRMMTQGVLPQDLDFSDTADSPSSVFGAQGGQAARSRPNDIAGSHSRWRFKSAPAVEGGNTGWFIAGVGGDGNGSKDVFAFLEGLTLPVCTRFCALGLPEEPLAESVTIDFSGDNEGTPQQNGGARASDTARTADARYVLEAWDAAKKPQHYACVRNGESDNYVYYHILVDR